MSNKWKVCLWQKLTVESYPLPACGRLFWKSAPGHDDNAKAIAALVNSLHAQLGRCNPQERKDKLAETIRNMINGSLKMFGAFWHVSNLSDFNQLLLGGGSLCCVDHDLEAIGIIL